MIWRFLIAAVASGSIGHPPVAPHAWAVGVGPSGIASLRAQLPGSETLVPGRALLVRGVRPTVRGAGYVVDLTASDRRIAFDNTEPGAAQQWYLPQDLAWSYWPTLPQLGEVKVAVIDSGIDYGHPDFAGRIAGGVSFAGGSWKTDTCGHGTFVAGIIAANPFNGIGMAGIAVNAKLLVVKILTADCVVSSEAEVRGIRWAVDHGARIINMSLGGVRDPLDEALDTFSPPEQAAIDYATSKGVLVIAAAGNGTQSPSTPWRFAGYPAALNHVIGVGAIQQSGAVPDYSNRDPRYVDLVAPGGPIYSTIPRSLVDVHAGTCSEPYGPCGPSEFRNGIGTSFAAPQVAAAAALLLGTDPTLTPDQVAWLIERSATDLTPSTGCRQCVVGRDSFTGAGALDVAAALSLLGHSPLPARDAFEPNDDAGPVAAKLPPSGTVDATLDYWDDPNDVYAVTLVKGQVISASLARGSEPSTVMTLWAPGTAHVSPSRTASGRLAASAFSAGGMRLRFAAKASGVYYLEVSARTPSRSIAAYGLTVAVR